MVERLQYIEILQVPWHCGTGVIWSKYSIPHFTHISYKRCDDVKKSLPFETMVGTFANFKAF
ncbi:hypothetical protein EDM52_19870 [Brevibacillus invocatus]|uniref:Uncharacterized protein n=1 Tax=Brevibacillus invocatus TaxID=173959 RepID=A0A3M8BZ94_9BACL|nr:hypothetical protein EDM52_19870 [Brevibacillus invocatus]